MRANVSVVHVVAAAGLPQVRKDHAFVMARFARDCMERFPKLVREMEVVLGPDTSDLGKWSFFSSIQASLFGHC